jgi:RNA polymerase sigma-70 factor (ECF subfamily)
MIHAPAAVRPCRPTERDPELDRAVEEFTRVRPRLQGIAYRILGRRAEAEDVVQEAWLRWQLYDRSQVRNPTAFLVTTTTRLALNLAQTARVRREWNVGEWMREPVAPASDPSAGAERTAELEAGIRLLVQKLTPSERAAYVLRQAFDCPYPHIAAILQLTEANVRQLVSRAGKHLTTERQRRVDDGEPQRLVRAFVAASGSGEVAALEHLLAAPARASQTEAASGLADGSPSRGGE